MHALISARQNDSLRPHSRGEVLHWWKERGTDMAAAAAAAAAVITHKAVSSTKKHTSSARKTGVSAKSAKSGSPRATHPCCNRNKLLLQLPNLYERVTGKGWPGGKSTVGKSHDLCFSESWGAKYLDWVLPGDTRPREMQRHVVQVLEGGATHSLCRVYLGKFDFDPWFPWMGRQELALTNMVVRVPNELLSLKPGSMPPDPIVSCVVETDLYKKKPRKSNYYWRFKYDIDAGKFVDFEKMPVQCLCQQPVAPDRLYVVCGWGTPKDQPSCGRLFHPRCVGSSMVGVKRERSFRCPTCTRMGVASSTQPQCLGDLEHIDPTTLLATKIQCQRHPRCIKPNRHAARCKFAPSSKAAAAGAVLSLTTSKGTSAQARSRRSTPNANKKNSKKRARVGSVSKKGKSTRAGKKVTSPSAPRAKKQFRGKPGASNSNRSSLGSSSRKSRSGTGSKGKPAGGRSKGKGSTGKGAKKKARGTQARKNKPGSSKSSSTPRQRMINSRRLKLSRRGSDATLVSEPHSSGGGSGVAPILTASVPDTLLSMNDGAEHYYSILNQRSPRLRGPPKSPQYQSPPAPALFSDLEGLGDRLISLDDPVLPRSLMSLGD